MVSHVVVWGQDCSCIVVHYHSHRKLVDRNHHIHEQEAAVVDSSDFQTFLVVDMYTLMVEEDFGEVDVVVDNNISFRG
jgi:hypothetical protein